MNWWLAPFREGRIVMAGYARNYPWLVPAVVFTGLLALGVAIG